MRTLKTMKNYVRVLFGLGAMMLSVMPVSAMVYVVDPVPTIDAAGTGGRYKASVKLYGQSTTNAAIIGETGTWGAYDAGTVFMPETQALTYPSNILLTATSGAFAIRTNGITQVDGHIQSRAITGLPTSGTVYMSLLTRIDSTGISYLTNGMSMGMGLSTNSMSAKLAFGALPPNGVYFGYCSNTITGPGRALMLNVSGQNYCLVSNPAVNTTFFCVAKIDIGAGEGGADVVSAVVNPATMPTTPEAYTVTVTNWVLNGGSFSHLTIGGAIRTNDKRIQFDEIRVASTVFDVAPFYADRPEFGIAPTVTCGADNIFRFSSTLTNVTADTQLFACYGTTSGSASTSSWEYAKLVSSPPTVNVESTTTLDSFATNTCYTFAALATNANFSILKTGATFMTGEVWLTPGSNAWEYSSIPGSIIVHRPATATQADLVVNYTVSGTATPDVNYLTNNLVGSVTIPAGQETASIAVLPLVSPSSSSPSVSITLAEGRYYIGAANTASINIENYNYPSDKNIWVALSTGRASDYRNWSQGRIPNATDAIQLDSSSTNSMFWDAPTNGLTSTVMSWTQTTNYTGTVTFYTAYASYDTAFTNFAVIGDVAITNGVWTQLANSAAQAYHLQVSVGGNFTLVGSAKMDVQGRGFVATKFPVGGAVGVHGGSRDSVTNVYGDVYRPTAIGAGASYTQSGGGAIWLEIGGDALIAGTLNAKAADSGAQTAVGAGGSIYIRAKSASGSGTVSVAGNGYYGQPSGSGGRIAVELTEANTLGMSLANFSARSGWGSTSTGAGTIMIKTASQTYGQLVVDNFGARSYGCHPPTKFGTTPVSIGQTWTFDSILFRNFGVLSVPTGTTLRLPGGLASIGSSNSSLQSGILYMGGTIDLGATPQWTFASNWVFQADSPYVITGDVTVANGGAIGCIPQIRNTLSSYAKMDLTVVGNLNVATGGKIIADNAGLDYPQDSNLKGFHGGQSAADMNVNRVYGSILNPILPGSFSQNGDRGTIIGGGGAVLLTVTGNLNVDGVVSSTSLGGSWLAAGGTININAGTLTGNGTIKANGGVGAAGSKYSGGGGRVAVRLTQPGATFEAFGMGDIRALGTSFTTLSSSNMMSSAGTVYLQTKSDAEGAGLVIVRNDNIKTNTFAATWFPSVSSGGGSDVFAKASLSIEDCAVVRLSTNAVVLSTLRMSTNTLLNLNGGVMTVRRMTAGGAPVGRGTYTSGSSLFTSGYLLDTSAGVTGALIVLGEPSLISIR